MPFGYQDFPYVLQAVENKLPETIDEILLDRQIKNHPELTDLPLVINFITYSTGNVWLDSLPEDYVEIEADKETILHLSRLHKQALKIENKIKDFAIWLEQNLPDSLNLIESIFSSHIEKC
jgi:hypothetical protein